MWLCVLSFDAALLIAHLSSFIVLSPSAAKQVLEGGGRHSPLSALSSLLSKRFRASLISANSKPCRTSTASYPVTTKSPYPSPPLQRHLPTRRYSSHPLARSQSAPHFFAEHNTTHAHRSAALRIAGREEPPPPPFLTKRTQTERTQKNVDDFLIHTPTSHHRGEKRDPCLVILKKSMGILMRGGGRPHTPHLRHRRDPRLRKQARRPNNPRRRRLASNKAIKQFKHKPAKQAKTTN